MRLPHQSEDWFAMTEKRREIAHAGVIQSQKARAHRRAGALFDIYALIYAFFRIRSQCSSSWTAMPVQVPAVSIHTSIRLEPRASAKI